MTEDEIVKVLLENYEEDERKAMLDELEIPVEVKRKLLSDEMQMYRNTVYVLETRHRINKRLGNEESLEALVKELEKHHKYLDALLAELKSLG